MMEGEVATNYTNGHEVRQRWIGAKEFLPRRKEKKATFVTGGGSLSVGFGGLVAKNSANTNKQKIIVPGFIGFYFRDLWD